MARTYEAARRGGTRYHLPGCPALDVTRQNHEVQTLTRAQVLNSGLEPCALCRRDGMPHVTPLVLV